MVWKTSAILRPMKKLPPTPAAAPANAAGFANFRAELARLVARFGKNFKFYQGPHAPASEQPPPSL